jgi:hypothetical protein
LQRRNKIFWREILQTGNIGYLPAMFIPDTLRFLLLVAAIAGAVFGGAYALATFPPEQSEIIKPLPHEKLRQG